MLHQEGGRAGEGVDHQSRGGLPTYYAVIMGGSGRHVRQRGGIVRVNSPAGSMFASVAGLGIP